MRIFQGEKDGKRVTDIDCKYSNKAINFINVSYVLQQI